MEDFIKDGIINNSQWNSQQVKILFVLKEVNGNIGPDLTKWLIENRGLFGRTYPKVIKWAKTILEQTCEKDVAINDVIDKIAVINLKKIPGTSRTNKIQLKAFVEKYKEQLKEQIDRINPNIIVCGNVAYLYFDIYDEKIEKYDRYTTREEKNTPLTMYFHKERIILNAYHPSSWKYKTVENDFIEICDKQKDRIKQSLKF